MLPETVLTGRENPQELASALTPEDISYLIALLKEKEDDLRYASLLTLCARSDVYPDVYPYWDELAGKLDDPNSYQRSIGLMLIAHNVKWDTQHRFPAILETYMARCTDEKFITSRQAIQHIGLWAPYVSELLPQTAQTLMNIDILTLKDTQRKLILLDILHALAGIRRIVQIGEIDAYMQSALTGGILDKKSIKEIQGLI